MRASGHLEIVGRIKDVINRGGEKVFPAEVEAILYTHPKVAETHVVGVPDHRYGEQVRQCYKRSTHYTGIWFEKNLLVDFWRTCFNKNNYEYYSTL